MVLLLVWIGQVRIILNRIFSIVKTNVVINKDEVTCTIKVNETTYKKTQVMNYCKLYLVMSYSTSCSSRAASNGESYDGFHAFWGKFSCHDINVTMHQIPTVVGYLGVCLNVTIVIVVVLLNINDTSIKFLSYALQLSYRELFGELHCRQLLDSYVNVNGIPTCSNCLAHWRILSVGSQICFLWSMLVLNYWYLSFFDERAHNIP